MYHGATEPDYVSVRPVLASYQFYLGVLVFVLGLASLLAKIDGNALYGHASLLLLAWFFAAMLLYHTLLDRLSFSASEIRFKIGLKRTEVIALDGSAVMSRKDRKLRSRVGSYRVRVLTIAGPDGQVLAIPEGFYSAPEKWAAVLTNAVERGVLKCAESSALELLQRMGK